MKKLVALLLIFVLVVGGCSALKKPDNPLKNFMQVVDENMSSSRIEAFEAVKDAAVWVVGLSEEELLETLEVEGEPIAYKIKGKLLFKTSVDLDFSVGREHIRSAGFVYKSDTPMTEDDLSFLGKHKKAKTLYLSIGEPTNKYDTFEEFSIRLESNPEEDFSAQLSDAFSVGGNSYSIMLSRSFIGDQYFYQFRISSPTITNELYGIDE
ncbi:MAG: hypothetical protein ACOX3W_00620 [Christensenellaceae bacterium]|jgi:hypothetical protein